MKSLVALSILLVGLFALGSVCFSTAGSGVNAGTEFQAALKANDFRAARDALRDIDLTGPAAGSMALAFGKRFCREEAKAEQRQIGIDALSLFLPEGPLANHTDALAARGFRAKALVIERRFDEADTELCAILEIAPPHRAMTCAKHLLDLRAQRGDLPGGAIIVAQALQASLDRDDSGKPMAKASALLADAIALANEGLQSRQRDDALARIHRRVAERLNQTDPDSKKEALSHWSKVRDALAPHTEAILAEIDATTGKQKFVKKIDQALGLAKAHGRMGESEASATVAQRIWEYRTHPHMDGAVCKFAQARAIEINAINAKSSQYRVGPVREKIEELLRSGYCGNNELRWCFGNMMAVAEVTGETEEYWLLIKDFAEICPDPAMSELHRRNIDALPRMDADVHEAIQGRRSALWAPLLEGGWLFEDPATGRVIYDHSGVKNAARPLDGVADRETLIPLVAEARP